MQQKYQDKLKEALDVFIGTRVGDFEIDMSQNDQNEYHDIFCGCNDEADDIWNTLKCTVGEKNYDTLNDFDAAKNRIMCVLADAAYKQGLRDAVALMSEMKLLHSE